MKIINRMVSLAVVVPAVAMILLASGCATMSEEECLTADWHAIGYEDGAAGMQVAHLSKRRQACADHGVRPDAAAYRAGRDQGLELYCTEQRGFRLGRAGGVYGGVCPADLEGLFLRGHQAGREIYLARSALNEVAGAISERERDREYILDDITELSARLVSDDATREERVALLADIARLKDRHSELGVEIRDLEQELVIRESEYQEVQARSPY